MLDSKPTAIELFSGAGLFSLAFQQVGFRIIKAIEQNESAAKTYALNIGSHIEVADIRTVRPVGRCDVLIAGPPCQGFSTLGQRRPNDPRNRLCFEIVKWARATKPSLIVIENVSAFLQSDQFDSIKDALEADSFRVDACVLNAFDYGCPQLRNRAFVIANRMGTELVLPHRRRSLTSVRQAWKGLPPLPDGKNNHFAPLPSPKAMARMKVIPPGGDKRDVMKSAPQLGPESWWRLRCEVTDAWGRMKWEEPCNTIRTCFQNASKGRYIHPDQNRVMSLREAARLHTIPDWWRFDGYATHIAKQIGNSVPPALGRAIGRTVHALLS